MPIRLHSLPGKDLRNALNCMDIRDLINFSLCSNGTKNLVKSSNPKTFSAEIDENIIKLDMFVLGLMGRLEKQIQFVVHENSIELDRGNGIELLTKEGYTQSDWIAHLLSLSDSKVLELRIENVPSISYLDTVKQLFPKCYALQIGENCSMELTKAAVSKYSSDVEVVIIESNPFDNENHISQFLNLNLEMLMLLNLRNPFKIELNDLLLVNSEHLSIDGANFTERELNRFLKLWMKGSHRFYRPEHIDLSFRNEINREEVLKGINYQTMDDKHRLRRADGNELLISIGEKEVAFEFEG
ncbi:hypothetical protein B9Z55_021590 [Caenorhabditis nigoni]|nr:hypothetical protein B9Z55_021590 [Caenorhabditis nigoni]